MSVIVASLPGSKFNATVFGQWHFEANHLRDLNKMINEWITAIGEEDAGRIEEIVITKGEEFGIWQARVYVCNPPLKKVG